MIRLWYWFSGTAGTSLAAGENTLSLVAPSVSNIITTTTVVLGTPSTTLIAPLVQVGRNTRVSVNQISTTAPSASQHTQYTEQTTTTAITITAGDIRPRLGIPATSGQITVSNSPFTVHLFIPVGTAFSGAIAPPVTRYAVYRELVDSTTITTQGPSVSTNLGIHVASGSITTTSGPLTITTLREITTTTPVITTTESTVTIYTQVGQPVASASITTTTGNQTIRVVRTAPVDAGIIATIPIPVSVSVAVSGIVIPFNVSIITIASPIVKASQGQKTGTNHITTTAFNPSVVAILPHRPVNDEGVWVVEARQDTWYVDFTK